ncbi:uncharacterized protein [Primulina eburnea]|uniref:uncharacterized protein n=1 Tax=Primulina eburnea TaxID=1245227 RepID=UPI003C6C84AF
MGDADRVRCSTYIFRDDASLWWEGAEHGIDLATLTCVRFKVIFYEKYFTADIRGCLMREFMSLRQGDTSVAEFVRKFDRRCYFVPLIARDAAEKLRHFLDGLRPTIQCDVMMMRSTDYVTATTYACQAEQALKDMQQNRQQHQPHSQPNKKPYMGPPRLQGRIFILDVATYALLDSGATHSFISETFFKRLNIVPEDMGLGFKVSIPTGDQMITSSIINNMELRLQKYVIQADLIVLPMPEFGIILGMDWLSLNGASIDF